MESVEYKTFNQLYEKGIRFIEDTSDIKFLDKRNDGFISGFTFKAVEDGKIRFTVEDEVVPPDELEKAFNYIIFLRTLKR